MSFFAVKLAELLERNHAREEGPSTQSELARVTKLSEAFISKLARAKQTSITPEDLSLIALNITSEPRERAELVAAHLKDERNGPGSELVEIRILNGPAEIREVDVNYRPLPPKLERDFEILRRNSDNVALRTILDGLADLLEEEDAANSPVDQAAADIVGAAVDDILSARAGKRRKPPLGPTTYKVPRRSKRQPPAGDDAT